MENSSKKTKQKTKKASTGKTFSILSIVWFALGISFMFSENMRAMAVCYISVGCCWLAIGSSLTKRGEKSDSTIQYYEDHAEEFVEGTMNADMSDARNRFLQYIPENGLILDWGCGSGRDSLAFREAGYQVEASDASEALCQIASEKLGQEVKCAIFDELDEKNKYDGIWACASLLHDEEVVLPEHFRLACRALKPNGVMYASFKYGDFKGMRGERYFTDLTEESLAKMLKGIKKFEIIDQWVTEDVRADRDEKWLNVMLRKVQN